MTVIVTGGTHGIGLAMVEVLAADDAPVVFTGRDDAAGAAIERRCPGAIFVGGDVRDEVHRKEVIARALTRGPIRGLVNNAGGVVRGRFDETTPHDLQHMLVLNFVSAVELTRTALPHLSPPASLVHIASIAGWRGRYGLSEYTASKAALIGWSSSIALEFDGTIRSNCVCPGEIATRMTGPADGDPDLRLRGIPGRRSGSANDVARLVRFLLSDSSSYINGAAIPVDGGETAGGALP